MIVVNVVDVSGARHTINAQDGLSVMETVRALKLGVIGKCGGSLACGTCHVWVDPEWLPRVGDASDYEADMLDGVFHVQPNSRLSCQIRVTPQLDGLTIRIPHD